MRKVFSSNSQLAHMWAQQNQEEGSASHLFFEKNKIWSYGRHFLAAEIHTLKSGKRVALVNSRRYSVSTAKHLSIIHGALRGLMPVFSASDPSNMRQAQTSLDKAAKNAIDAVLKDRLGRSSDSVRWKLEQVTSAFDDATKLRKLLGMPAIRPRVSDLKRVKAHLKEQLTRYMANQTPEAIERRRVAREKATAQETKRQQEKLANDIAEFRAGQRNHVLGLTYDLIRIRGSEIVTSRGASVPLVDAVRVYAAIKSGKNFNTQIGHFRFQSIDRTLADPVIIAGCHRILLSEIDTVLSKVDSINE